jgi:nitroreductase
MSLDNIIRSRRSRREFSDKKPNWRFLLQAIDASKYAPAAGNIFSLKCILVDEKEKIHSIAEACQQDFVAKAPYLIVVCSKPSMLKSNFPEKISTRFMHQQAGAAIQNILLKLEEYKLAACWVGGFVENTIRSILRISEDINIEAIIAIGYPLKKARLKVKKPELETFIFFNKYGNRYMKPLPKED